MGLKPLFRVFLSAAFADTKATLNDPGFVATGLSPTKKGRCILALCRTQTCPRSNLKTSLRHPVWSPLGSMGRVALGFRDGLKCSLCYMAPVPASSRYILHDAWYPLLETFSGVLSP